MQIKTNNVDKTMEIGKLLGSFLQNGDCICLDGDLGAGKTHLTKGIALGLGILEDITSPTFTIVQEYDAAIRLFHFDVYRLSDEQELYEIGFSDYLKGNGALVIEWASNVKNLLPPDRLEIHLSYTDKADERILDIRATGNQSEILLEKLEKSL
ncbi:MAG: tRNA (adenosine(37)-N6)-threonylcarbamoyltransferase complex ATPase subunit type 1 TsaE [Peptostreptococcaceae bacterium]|nr:tRNA (adenosine(37)-N6)-threonylcarbamoyltransferase complex ATPase subunit type 1 TsaE [Peptostreptococcaceae bacterium]